MRPKKLLSLALMGTPFVLLLSGCTQLQKNDAKPEENDIVRALHDYKEQTNKYLDIFDYVDLTNTNPGYRVENGYNTYRRWWCPFEPYDIQTTREMIRDYCESKGGVYRDNWCSSETEDGPIFFAEVGSPSIVSNHDGVHCEQRNELGVVAITGEGKNPASWRFHAINELGYLPVYLREYEQMVRQKEAEEAALREAQQKQREKDAILTSGIGTRVCLQQREIRFIGVVEQTIPNQAKIFIQDARIYGSPNLRPGGFQQQHVWTDVIGWERC